MMVDVGSFAMRNVAILLRSTSHRVKDVEIPLTNLGKST